MSIAMNDGATAPDRRTWRFEGRTRASAETVYDLLATPSEHLEWAGRRQWPNFRLVSVDAPGGPADVGTEFTSVGRIPTIGVRWQNRNVVTAARRPHVFEITTEGQIPWPRGEPGVGTFVNRFEIGPDRDGARVVYTMRQLRFERPPWGMRYPILREVTYRFWIPIWAGRGLRALLQQAEEREAREAAARAATEEK